MKNDWWGGLSGDQRVLVGVVVAMWCAQLLYLISPIDVLPDFIPILGQLDDLLTLGASIALTVYAVKTLNTGRGFSGLVPEALRPRSVASTLEPTPPTQREPDLHDAGHGDSLGIPGYRPLSYDEMKSL